MQEHALKAARVFMGDSLGFHILFVLLGLTLPILVVWFEWLALRKNDAKLLALAHKWSKIMGVLVITGVISGTIIALQMSLVWPGILKFGGDVIGLPFMFETYAFLIEAVFLALYLSTWNNKKVPRKAHLMFGGFVILGSTLSAYAITSVNAWMNLPTGFTIVQGKFENVDVFKAMFSQTAIIEFAHSMLAYYLAASLFIAGLYGYKIIKSRKKDRLSSKHSLDWFVVHKMMLVVAGCILALVVTGDITGKYLAKHEPEKLAAIELVNETSTNVPFIYGGVANEDGTISGPYIKIPNALSLLVGGKTNTMVTGLNETPKEQRPPAYIHILFDIKMTLLGVMSAVVVIYLAIKKWRSNWLSKNWLLFTITVTGLIGMILVELGWMITEIGRQPWAVRGYVTTEQAITKTHDITSFGYIFPLTYVLLFVVTIAAVRRIVSQPDVERNKK